MKLLMTTDTVGGVWTYSLELALALSKFDVQTTLASMGRLPSHEQQREAGAIPGLELRASAFKLEWMDDPWDDVARAGEWLLEIASEISPDIVHLNGFVHGALSWPAPVLMVGHSCVLSWWDAAHGCSAPLEWNRYKEVVRSGLQSADCIIAPSRSMLRSLQYNYGPLPKSLVIPNARRPESFRAVEKEQFIFIAGRLWDRAKNLEAVTAIASRLSWPVFAAGEGANSENVRSLGVLSSDKIAQWLSRAAIYVLPAKYEPFGLSVLEAALSGCALVLGDIESLRENWDGAAAFAPPSDKDELLARLNYLIENETERTRLQAAACERARDFSPNRMADAYMSCYSTLQERGRSSFSISSTAKDPGSTSISKYLSSGISR